MARFTLPFCLLLALVGAVPAHAKAERAELRPGEKVALALLGMIGSGDPDRIDRAHALWPLQAERDLLRPLATALTCNPASLRVFAAERLGALDDARAVRPLLHRVVREGQPAVRRALVSALRRHADPHSAHVLGRALFSRNPTHVRHAAEAIASLGDLAAAPYVIQRWSGRSGDFPRVYLAQLRQRSYIQDFDVEVAATSFIADPIIGVSQEGSAHPVKIVGTEQTETRLFHATLAKLAGRDLGSRPAPWQAWWKALRAR